MAEEKCLVHYLKQTTYNNDPENQVGTDADHVSLFPDASYFRTVPTPTGDIAYVRKFGVAHTIKDLTNLSDPGVANLTWTVKTSDGVTTYGSRANGGAYTDGSTTSDLTGIILECSAAGGAATLPANMTLTDADFGALTVILPQEIVADGATLILYISAGGSSYYDTSYMYGGDRHTPALYSTRYSYFDIATAYGALAASNGDGVEILDSQTYDEELTLNQDDIVIYSTSGQSPTITRGIGARVTREVSTQYNNSTAIYFNESGDNADAGTWQAPKLTIAGAIAARAAEDVVYGGTGASGTAEFTLTVAITINAFTIEPDYGYIPTITQGSGGVTDIIDLNNNGTIRGFNVKTEYSGITYPAIFTNPYNIYDCYIYRGNLASIYAFVYHKDYAVAGNLSMNFKNNYVYNMRVFYGSINDGITLTADFDNNRFQFELNVLSDLFVFNPSAAATSNLDLTMTNNEFKIINAYSGTCINIFGTVLTVDGNIDNNTFFSSVKNNTVGIYIVNIVWGVYSIKNNIIMGFNKGIWVDTVNTTIDYTNFYNNTADKTTAGGAVITSNNELTTDPQLINSSVYPYNPAISANSPSFKSGASETDRGFERRNVLISADDNIFNGIKFSTNF